MTTIITIIIVILGWKFVGWINKREKKKGIHDDYDPNRGIFY